MKFIKYEGKSNINLIKHMCVINLRILWPCTGQRNCKSDWNPHNFIFLHYIFFLFNLYKISDEVLHKSTRKQINLLTSQHEPVPINPE